MFKLKKLAWPLATAVIIAALSACGGNKNEENGGNNQSASNPPDKKITLKMIQHANQATNDAVAALNEEFTKLYPNITIETDIVDSAQYPQMLQTRLAAGDVDLIEFSTFGMENPDWAKGVEKKAEQQYIENGDILDLTGQAFLDNWDPNMIRDAATFQGKVYDLNIGKVAYNGIFYNKTIFEQYSLQEPRTWDEFLNICRTLQENNISPLTSGAKDSWPMGMMTSAFVNANESDVTLFAKSLWTGDRKFNDPQTLKLFEKMQQFASYFEKGVTSVDYASVVGRFVSGKAAMMPDGTWQAAQISEADPNFAYGYFTIPGDAAADKPVQLAGKYDIGYAGYAKSKNTDAILKWLDFLSKKENYTKFVNKIGFIPTMTGVELDNAFMNSLAPINQDFQVNFEIVNRNPKGLGKYGGFAIMQFKELGGSVKSAQELADLAQQDWETAIKAASN